MLHEAMVKGNLAQHGLKHVLLAGEFFHFAVRKLGRLQHGQSHDLGAIANEKRALLLVALQRQLNAALDVEAVYFFEPLLSARSVWRLLWARREFGAGRL